METLLPAIISIPVLAWLVRSIIKHWMDKDVEAYKAKLSAEHDREMENFRHALQIQAQEHEIRFRNIHEKQAEVIAEAYAKLHAVYAAIESYVSIMEWSGELSKQEKLEKAAKAVSEFNDYFFPKRIFLPKETAAKMDTMVKSLIQLGSRFTQSRIRREKDVTADMDTWFKVWEELRAKVPPIFNDLQKNLQDILGIK